MSAVPISSGVAMHVACMAPGADIVVSSQVSKLLKKCEKFPALTQAVTPMSRILKWAKVRAKYDKKKIFFIIVDWLPT